MLRTRLLHVLVLLGLLGYGPAALAQLELGQIKGKIVDDANGRPLSGVTVVVQGPAMQGEQTEFTDASGNYQITEIPSGDNYVVRFYYNDVVVERKDVRISQSKTLTISLSMPTQRGARKAYVIKERPPNVDTASANTGVEINQEILQNTATRGRTFESVIALAPGASDVAPQGNRPGTGVAGGDVGTSFSGSTGNENSFLIDGLNTTDPNLGVIGTQLNNYFIKEVQVITGGYQAEYGRATGGLISVVTKSGSNEFHGSVFGSWQPFQLEPNTVARLGEALATQRRQTSEYDFGFELGGPIVKDRLWFYIGFAPTFTNFHTDRFVRNQLLDPMTGKAQLDRNFVCPGYLAFDTRDMGSYCDGPRQLAFVTQNVPNRTLGLDERRTRYNWIAKLQYNINPDHNITLGYIGSPETYDGYASLRNDLAANKYSETDQIHDLTLHYIGKFLDRKLQLDLMYGYHYQNVDVSPNAVNKQSITFRGPASNPYSLADFEDVSECARKALNPAMPVNGNAAPGAGNYFNPCPVTSYQLGGYGLYHRQTLQRHVILAGLTYFLSLHKTYVLDGTHAFKLGFDFEDGLNDDFRAYTGTDVSDPVKAMDPTQGHRIYRTSASGSQIKILREFSTQDPTLPGGIRYLNGFDPQTETRNYAVYLRDVWNFERLPGLVVSAGVRWEAQQVIGSPVDPLQKEVLSGLGRYNEMPIAIYDNWAPRVGAAYDFTRKGRSKLFFNYGRFFESIPMDINDRQFSGEGLVATNYSGTCPKRPYTAIPGARGLFDPTQMGCNFTGPVINGGAYAPVAPGLQGQYIDEIVAGFQYDVGLDVVLGVSYTHRGYGNIIEDLSTDGGNFYIIGNPGQGYDTDRAAQAQKDADQVKMKAADIAKQAMMNPSDATLQAKAAIATQAGKDAQSAVDAYKAIGYIFPKAKREYHAVTFTANKRLSNRFSVLASYTFSRTWGNYPGNFSPSNGQVDPNISSQFDLVDLLANRDGPLPTDRPHNVKLTGFYVQPIGRKGSLIASLTFTAISGRPIEVLGFHPTYGAREVFILPRGSGGRTPMVSQFDLHLGYEHALTNNVRLMVYGDVVNLFNQQEITNVDDEYTTSTVNPIVNGKPQDLVRLRATDGTAVVPNSNYGQPTSFQAPLYMRFGARLAF